MHPPHCKRMENKKHGGNFFISGLPQHGSSPAKSAFPVRQAIRTVMATKRLGGPTRRKGPQRMMEFVFSRENNSLFLVEFDFQNGHSTRVRPLSAQPWRGTEPVRGPGGLGVRRHGAGHGSISKCKVERRRWPKVFSFQRADVQLGLCPDRNDPPRLPGKRPSKRGLSRWSAVVR